jgi:hypothetical protein
MLLSCYAAHKVSLITHVYSVEGQKGCAVAMHDRQDSGIGQRTGSMGDRETRSPSIQDAAMSLLDRRSGHG